MVFPLGQASLYMDHLHLQLLEHFLLFSLTLHMPFELIHLQDPLLPLFLCTFSPNSPMHS